MIKWSEEALTDLKQTVNYLIQFPKATSAKFHYEILSYLNQIEINPEQFPLVENYATVRKVVILNYNTLYYKVEDDIVYIIRVFSNRQDPRDINF